VIGVTDAIRLGCLISVTRAAGVTGAAGFTSAAGTAPVVLP
jgi:hypothetical protein